MSWARIDDGFYDHPKIMRAGNAAAGLYARSLSYAAKHATDGFVPGELVTVMFGDAEGEHSAALVAVGLFASVPGGFEVHDYLDYNPSALQVKRERRAARVRMQRFRARSGNVRANGNGEVTSHEDGAVPGREGKGSSASFQEPSGTRKKTGSRARAWRTVPAGEELTPARRTFAITAGLAAERVPVEWADFLDCEFKAARTDVDRTWRRWVRESLRRAGNGNGAGLRRWTSPRTAGNVDALRDFAGRKDAEKIA